MIRKLAVLTMIALVMSGAGISTAAPPAGKGAKTTLTSLECTQEGAIAKFLGGQWVCNVDNDTDTDTLGGLNCAQDEIAKFNGVVWVCDADNDTGTDTLGGLNCATDQVAKCDGIEWVCAEANSGLVVRDGSDNLLGTVITVSPAVASTSRTASGRSPGRPEPNPLFSSWA